VKRVDIGTGLLTAELPEGFALLGRLLPFLLVVVEGTDLRLVAPGPVAEDSLVLVRMVESFHGGVALVTLEAFVTFVPSNALHQSLTILRQILE